MPPGSTLGTTLNVSIGRPVSASVTVPRMRNGWRRELQDRFLVRWLDRRLTPHDTLPCWRPMRPVAGAPSQANRPSGVGLGSPIQGLVPAPRAHEMVARRAAAPGYRRPVPGSFGPGRAGTRTAGGRRVLARTSPRGVAGGLDRQEVLPAAALRNRNRPSASVFDRPASRSGRRAGPRPRRSGGRRGPGPAR